MRLNAQRRKASWLTGLICHHRIFIGHALTACSPN